MDAPDPASPPTHENKRTKIVEQRLWRGLGGTLAGLFIGLAVLWVDKPTGKWLMASALLLIGASGFYLLRTLLRKFEKRRHTW